MSALLQRELGDRVAEAHRHQRRQHVGHHGAVRGDRPVVVLGVVDPRVQRAAHEHLPFAEHDRAAGSATNATQKCARTSFLARNTAEPFAAACAARNSCGGRTWTRAHIASWPVPQYSWHGIRCSPVFEKRGRERRDEARNQHRVGVGRADDEAVDRVGGRAAEGHRHLGRHDDALRLERVLLRDQADRDSAQLTSHVRNARLLQLPLREPVVVNNPRPGLRYQYWEGLGTEDFRIVEKSPATKTGSAETISLAPRGSEGDFGFRFAGLFDAPVAGIYTFTLRCSPRGQLRIGEQEVVDSQGRKARAIGTSGVEAGPAPARIRHLLSHSERQNFANRLRGSRSRASAAWCWRNCIACRTTTSPASHATGRPLATDTNSPPSGTAASARHARAVLWAWASPACRRSA